MLSQTNPDGSMLSYGYDLAGNRISVTIPSGTTNYTFDALNRLDTVISPNNKITDYNYDANSNLIETFLPNGITEIREYDSLNRLIYLENINSLVEVISSYSYTLNPVGLRTSVEENDGRKVNYTYDNLYRLTKEKILDSSQGNRSFTYTYDNVGNRLTKVDSGEGLTTTYTYDDNDRLLTETNGTEVTTYTYDNNGNTLTTNSLTETRVYDWDYENRLKGVSITNGSENKLIEYQYDVNGIRVASLVDGIKTDYLVDLNQMYPQVLEEYVEGELVVSYVYGKDLISQTQEDTQTFYLVDALGSTRVLTDENGLILNVYDYEAFGELLTEMETVNNKYLFAGEQYDENLGDYYLRARYYDPASGRFTGRDSYEGRQHEPTTLHKYIYGNDSPVNYTDPSGFVSLPELQTVLAFGTIIASIGLAVYIKKLDSIAIQFRQVEGMFDRSTGTLFLKDLSGRTNAPFGTNTIITTAFSGNDPYKNKPEYDNVIIEGLIPYGNYEILSNPANKEWFRLDKLDAQPRNDIDDSRTQNILTGATVNQKRGEFRLHPGSYSLGCITIDIKFPKRWEAINELIQGTNVEWPILSSAGVFPSNLINWPLAKYGLMRVY